jgi:transcriptional regulator with XRE-family HTH domain
VPQLPRAILGKNINRLRMQRGLTQDDLAERAEIDRRHVQRMEAGTANPGIDVIVRVRHALGASWDELLEGLEDRNTKGKGDT